MSWDEMEQDRLLREEKKIKRAMSQIKKQYQTILREVMSDFSSMYSRLESGEHLTYEDAIKYGDLNRFVKQIEAHARTLGTGNQEQIQKLLEDTYEQSYSHMSFSIESAMSVLLANATPSMPRILKQVRNNPVYGLKLTPALERDRSLIVKGINGAIENGLLVGETYGGIAKGIQGSFNSSYKRAEMIAWTETHRVREKASSDAAMNAHEQGVKMRKIWRNMGDQRVRRKNQANHWQMEGQERSEDKPFDLIPRGQTDSPGNSGIASQDIRCRCYASRRVDRLEPQVPKRAADQTVKDYESWKQETDARQPQPKQPDKNKGISVQTNLPTTLNDMPSIRPHKRLSEFDSHEEGMKYREGLNKEHEAFEAYKKQQMNDFKQKENFFKNHKEAEKYIKEHILHPDGKMDIEGIDLPLVSGYCRMFEAVAKDFPSMKNSYRYFDKNKQGDSYVMEASGGVHFGNTKVEQVFENYTSHLQDKYCVGNSVYNLFLHEIGHYVERVQSMPAINEKHIAEGRTDRRMGSFWLDSFYKNSGIDQHIRKVQAMKRDPNQIDQAEKLSKEFLSEYSAKNSDEMFAELFTASYTNSANNKSIVPKFREWLGQVSAADKAGKNRVVEDKGKNIENANEKAKEQKGLDIWHD